MKKIFLLLFGIAVTVPAYADSLACKNCGTSSGNVIFVCEGDARHQSCNRCADSIGGLEGLNDDTDLRHKFAEVWTGDKVGKLLARCPHVTVNEAYGEIKKIPCKADIRKVVHDNRKQNTAAPKNTAKKKGKAVSRKKSANVPCKKCGVAFGNIVYLCSDSKHVSCNLCAHKVDGMEGMNDDTDIARQFADVLNGTKTGKLLAKCPHEVLKETANTKEMVPCLSPIRQILHDNRSEETIEAEQDAKDAALKKAAIELTAGQKKIKKEHAELQTSFDSAVKNKDLKKLAELVDKMYSHYVVHKNYTADFERERTRRKSAGAEDVLMKMQAGIYDAMFNETEPECYIMDQIPKIALECKNDDMIMALLNQNCYKAVDPIGKYNGRMVMSYFPKNYLEAAIKTGQPAFVELFFHHDEVQVKNILDTNNPKAIEKYMSMLSQEHNHYYGKEHVRMYMARYSNYSAEILNVVFKDATQSEKNVALAIAVDVNNEKVADYLLANGAKADVKIKIYKGGYTLYPYYMALRNGNVALAKKLKFHPGLPYAEIPCGTGHSRQYGPNSRVVKQDRTDYSCLELAIMKKQFASVKYLVEEEKCKPKHSDVEYARNAKSEEIEKYLEERCDYWESSAVMDSPMIFAKLICFPYILIENAINAPELPAAPEIEIIVDNDNPEYNESKLFQQWVGYK